MKGTLRKSYRVRKDFDDFNTYFVLSQKKVLDTRPKFDLPFPIQRKFRYDLSERKGVFKGKW